MIVQLRNEKVSNHGSIPITIDCNVVAFIVFEEGFHQPIKRTQQSVFLDNDKYGKQPKVEGKDHRYASKVMDMRKICLNVELVLQLQRMKMEKQAIIVVPDMEKKDRNARAPTPGASRMKMEKQAIIVVPDMEKEGSQRSCSNSRSLCILLKNRDCLCDICCCSMPPDLDCIRFRPTKFFMARG
ncbi:hypothetical protein TNCV_2773591 [Trichonephila clavipes]|nr:hypothetical protein TNCV_2773591 [Trichonephila clavipes]